MSYGETENIIADSEIREATQDLAAPEQTEQIALIASPAQASTSNQEAMLAQALKRLKRQGKDVERLVKIVKQLSIDSITAGKNQSKQLRQLQTDISKLSVAVKRIQTKSSRSAPKKKQRTARKAKITRKK